MSKAVEMVKEQDVKTETKPAVVPDFRKYLNVYEFEVTLPSGNKVTLKPINAGQLKKFMSSIKDESNLQELTESMYEMISSSVIDEGFDIGEVYLNDRSALIIELRKISKGSEFKFEYKCPHCKSQSIITEDLNNLDVTEKPVKLNPIVQLDKNLSVEMDYVRIKDEREILSLGMEKEHELLLSIIATSVSAIMTPEGDQENLSLRDKIFFTDNIPQPLYEKLTEWHDQFHFGASLNKKIVCRHCDKKSDYALEADNFFF